MKLTRSILSILLVLVLALSLGIAASADDTKYTVTINNTASGHTYEAYQIFKGDLSADGVLSNIVWGSGVNGANLLAVLKVTPAPISGLDFSNCSDAAAVAQVLSAANLSKDADAAKAFAQIVGQNLSTTTSGTLAYNSSTTPYNYNISGLSAGYYLVKDKDGTQTSADSYTRVILEVVKSVSVDPKGTVPTVEKKVKENVKYTADDGYGAGYNDVADYNIGDIVPFELIGTLPANYADYTTYNYIFNDTASAGLTIDSSSVKVYADGTEITTGFTTALNGQVLTVTFDNLKTITTLTATSKITVKYNATLNSSAVIGLTGNTNEVYLTFSNNPNVGGEGDTGKTPTDKVIVFTYELDVTKIDASDESKKLSGAKFELYKIDGTTNYYAKVENNKVTGWTTTETDATQLTSDANGLFKVAGLDDGTYYLKETNAPSGYNKLSAPVTLVISATTANGQTWTSGKASDALTALTINVDSGNAVDGNTTTGTVAATVKNNKGATLPTTGGIGTVLFTAAGAALMIFAGAALTVRYFKRRSASDDGRR